MILNLSRLFFITQFWRVVSRGLLLYLSKSFIDVLPFQTFYCCCTFQKVLLVFYLFKSLFLTSFKVRVKKVVLLMGVCTKKHESKDFIGNGYCRFTFIMIVMVKMVMVMMMMVILFGPNRNWFLTGWKA